MTRMKSKALILLLVLFAILLFSSAEISKDEKKSGTGDKESQVEKEVGDVKYGGGGGGGGHGGGCRKCCYRWGCRCCYPNEYPTEEYNQAADANYVPDNRAGGGRGAGQGRGGRGGGW